MICTDADEANRDAATVVSAATPRELAQGCTGSATSAVGRSPSTSGQWREVLLWRWEGKEAAAAPPGVAGSEVRRTEGGCHTSRAPPSWSPSLKVTVCPFQDFADPAPRPSPRAGIRVLLPPRLSLTPPSADPALFSALAGQGLGTSQPHQKSPALLVLSPK